MPSLWNGLESCVQLILPSQNLAHFMENLDISQWKSGKIILHPNQTVAASQEEFIILSGAAFF